MKYKCIITEMVRNKQGITTLTIKTGQITQKEFDEVSRTNKVTPMVEIEIES